MSKRVKNWSSDDAKYTQMFHMINYEVLVEMNNRDVNTIRELTKQKNEDFGDFFENPEDYDATDRKEYTALVKTINKKIAEHNKFVFHLSGLAEMISDYQKKQKQEKKSNSE